MKSDTRKYIKGFCELYYYTNQWYEMNIFKQPSIFAETYCTFLKKNFQKNCFGDEDYIMEIAETACSFLKTHFHITIPDRMVCVPMITTFCLNFYNNKFKLLDLFNKNYFSDTILLAYIIQFFQQNIDIIDNVNNDVCSTSSNEFNFPDLSHVLQLKELIEVDLTNNCNSTITSSSFVTTYMESSALSTIDKYNTKNSYLVRNDKPIILEPNQIFSMSHC